MSETDIIDWQDIRLICGEGKLSALDVYKAVNIILRLRGVSRSGEGTEYVPPKIIDAPTWHYLNHSRGKHTTNPPANT